jgi:AraC family transcriptional regulator, regulatory protein of adaptative response / methylated-DNA-[protein]-cysteine methyltransferase
VPLAELGRVAGLSPFTVQRLFKQKLGVSPLQYQRALRAGSLRSALKQGANVTDAIYEAGFGSSSRAYEGAALGMTPGRFAGRQGRAHRLGCAKSRFGWVVVGATDRGLCWLALAGTAGEAEASLRDEFPEATLRRDPTLSSLVDAAIAQVAGSDDEAGTSQPLALDLRGTAFQLRVWQALERFHAERRAVIASLRGRWANPRRRGRWRGHAL